MMVTVTETRTVYVGVPARGKRQRGQVFDVAMRHAARTQTPGLIRHPGADAACLVLPPEDRAGGIDAAPVPFDRQYATFVPAWNCNTLFDQTGT